jgi:hypothetical protein
VRAAEAAAQPWKAATWGLRRGVAVRRWGRAVFLGPAVRGALGGLLPTLGAYALFVALALIYSAPEWRGGRIAYQDDTRLFYYPVMAAVGEALRHGSLSLWTPGIFGGYPLFADGGVGPLYPPHFAFLRTFSAEQALVGLRILHLVLASAFAFHYARVLGLGTFGGLVAGVVFGYAGYFAAQTVHPNLAEASAWLPAALYCVERARRALQPAGGPHPQPLARAAGEGSGPRPQGGARWAAWLAWTLAGGIVVGVQALTVHVNITLMTALFLTLYTPLVFLVAPGAPAPAGWRAWPPALARRLAAGLATLALVGGVGLGLAAVQLLPLYELGTESFRGRGLSSSFAAVNSIAPTSLVTLLLPRFFDDPTYRTIGWSIWIPWETEIYVGLLPLLLALVALLARPGFYVLLYGTVGALGLLVGFGNLGPLPLWERLREVPFFNSLQSPGRFSLFWTLAVAVLAGHGAAWLVATVPRGRRWWTAGALAAVGLASGAALAALYAALPWIEAHRDQVLAWLTGYLATPGAPLQPTGEPQPATWAYPYLLAAVDPANPLVQGQVRLLGAALAALLALWIAARLGAGWPPAWPGARGVGRTLLAASQALVLLVIAGDLLPFGQGYHPRLALADLPAQVPPPLQKPPPPGEARIFTRPDPTRQFLDAPNVLLPTGWEEVTGFSSLEFDRHARYVAQVERADNHLLDLLNARYVLARGRLPDLPVFGGVPYHPGRALVNGTAENPGARVAFTVARVTSREIGLVSWLRGARDVPQGAEVGQVIVTDATGATYTLPLRAGLETADADLDGAPPESPNGHQAATVVEALPAALADGRAYRQQRYYGTVQLPRPVEVTRIEVRFTWPKGQFEVFGLAPLRHDGEVEYIPPKEKYHWLWGDQRWLVVENTAALPRAFLVSSGVVARQDQDVLAWMADGAFDPRRLVILERPDAPDSPWPGWQLLQDVPPGEAHIERYTSEEVVIRTRSQHDGFLVLLDPYYPGWTATVDGLATEIYCADYLFRSVFVPAGEHVVRFRYAPAPFRVGAAAGLATAALVALAYYTLLVRWLVRRMLRTLRARAPRQGEREAPAREPLRQPALGAQVVERS